MNYLRRSVLAKGFLNGGSIRRMMATEQGSNAAGSRFTFTGGHVCWGIFWTGFFGYGIYDMSFNSQRIEANKEISIARIKNGCNCNDNPIRSERNLFSLEFGNRDSGKSETCKSETCKSETCKSETCKSETCKSENECRF